jgi:hypothetical protein
MPSAIASFGFTERQARFLLNVLLHSGVFVERQFLHRGIACLVLACEKVKSPPGVNAGGSARNHRRADDPRVRSASSLTTADGISFRERCDDLMVPVRSTAVDTVPEIVPASSQNGASRANSSQDDGRNADRRLANRYVPCDVICGPRVNRRPVILARRAKA